MLVLLLQCSRVTPSSAEHFRCCRSSPPPAEADRRRGTIAAAVAAADDDDAAAAAAAAATGCSRCFLPPGSTLQDLDPATARRRCHCRRRRVGRQAEEAPRLLRARLALASAQEYEEISCTPLALGNKVESRELTTYKSWGLVGGVYLKYKKELLLCCLSLLSPCLLLPEACTLRFLANRLRTLESAVGLQQQAAISRTLSLSSFTRRFHTKMGRILHRDQGPRDG